MYPITRGLYIQNIHPIARHHYTHGTKTSGILLDRFCAYRYSAQRPLRRGSPPPVYLFKSHKQESQPQRAPCTRPDDDNITSRLQLIHYNGRLDTNPPPIRVLFEYHGFNKITTDVLDSPNQSAATDSVSRVSLLVSYIRVPDHDRPPSTMCRGNIH